MGGNPAKIIRYRFAPEIIQALDKIKWWYWPLEKIKANRQYMENVEEFIARFGEKNPKVENIAVSSSAADQGETAVDKQKNNQTIVPPIFWKNSRPAIRLGAKSFTLCLIWPLTRIMPGGQPYWDNSAKNTAISPTAC